MEAGKRRRCLSGTSAGQEGSIADCSVLAKYLGSAVALKQTLVQSFFFFFQRYLIRMNKIVISYVKIFTVVTAYPKKDLKVSFVMLHAFLIDTF